MHNHKFFSYLSLITFMMIILITGNNLLLMFVGGIGVGICSYLIVNLWFTIIPGNKRALTPLSKNIVQKYPKLTAVFISSAIATLVGISIRTFFLLWKGLDLMDFPHHPILCSINLFSINSIRFGIKLWLEVWLLPSNVLMMNNAGEGSTTPSTPPIGGTAKPATGSSSGDIDALLKKINDLNKGLNQSVVSSNTVNKNYLELLEAYRDLYSKEIGYVDDLLKKHFAYMDTSQKEKFGKLVKEYSIKANTLNSKYKSLNDTNDPLGIKRIILDKQKFQYTIDMQNTSGNLIRESVLKASKEGKISKDETKTFITSWVEISRNRPNLKEDIFSKIDELEKKAKSMNSKSGGKKG